MDSREIKKRALAGSVWTLFGYGSGQVVRLGSNLVLAHLLFPAAFGVMALVSVVMLGIQSFSDIGVGPSIIQNKKGDDPDFFNTAWTMGVIRGFLIWIAACLLAWPAARFFGRSDPLALQLLWILPVVGFTAALGGFYSTSIYLINRRLQFGWVTMLDLIPQLCTAVTMIVSAWIHPSVWALVEGGIVGTAVHVVMSHWLNLPVRNRFCWNAEALHELKRFGGWIFVSTIVTFFAGNLDRIVLGKLLTLKELGLYSIALNFARFPIEISNRVAAFVLFPVLSRSQDDPVTLIGQSLKARGIILMGGGAAVCSFAILAPPFFTHLYDPRYAAAGAISQWISILIWFNIVLSSMDRIPMALGHPRALFVASLLTTAGYGVAMLGFWRGGLPEFILGLCSGSIIAHLVLLKWIPIRRNAMLMQTVVYTVGFALYGVAAVSWMHWIAAHAEPRREIAAAFLSAMIPCAAAGFIVLRRVRRTVAS